MRPRQVDTAEREHRRAPAAELVDDLPEQDVVAVALTRVDHSGITRVKSVPLAGLPRAAADGVGASPVFDAFLLDDTIVSGRHAGGPVGDLRLRPDLDRLTVLAGRPGWAWAPADRFDQQVELSDYAADTSVLVRETVRAITLRHGLRPSFSPKVTADGVGNGGHPHLSLWRDGRNLFDGGEGWFGLTEDAEAFAAGVPRRLPALYAIGVPAVAGHLRLVPRHWAGAFAVWGLENREAALRLIAGRDLEVKCYDLSANPYLVVAATMAVGPAGIVDRARLPEPVGVDPAAVPDAERLPTCPEEAVAAFEADEVLTEAFGAEFAATIVDVRRGEIARFAHCSPEEVAALTRRRH